MLKDSVKTLVPYLTEWLDFQTWYRRVPGAQVAVRVDGELLYSAGHGVADIETGEKLTPQHHMRVASHSKSFAAVLTILLKRDGKLRLDDEVQVHCPQYQDTFAGDLTLRDLLSHTSGMIRDGKNSDHWQELEPFPDSAALVESVRNDGHQMTPGHIFKYSNIAFGVLGQVLETVGGASFDELVRDKIATPLGLNSTYGDYHEGMEGPFAGTYGKPSYPDYDRAEFSQVSTGALAPATGVVSTAEDLSKFFAALQPGAEGILDDRERYALARPHGVTKAGNSYNRYGLGHMTVDFPGGRSLTGHTGGWPGTLSQSGVSFDDGLAVSVVANSLDGPASPYVRGILALVDLAEKSNAGWQKNAEGVDLDTFVGRYESPWEILDVVRFGDRLVGINPEAPNPSDAVMELVATSETTLRVEDADGFGTEGEDMHLDLSGDVPNLRVVGESHLRVRTW